MGKARRRPSSEDTRKSRQGAKMARSYLPPFPTLILFGGLPERVILPNELSIPRRLFLHSVPGQVPP